jgi:hypothetical protein
MTRESGCLLDLSCQIEIQIRDSASFMGGQEDNYGSPADVDVGVVAGSFGEICDLVHERDRVPEAGAAIAFADAAFFTAPAR